MTDSLEPRERRVEGRFHDLSADVREERLVRYITSQVKQGRHVNEIIEDPYVVDHFDEYARNRILEHPTVIKSIEESIRRQFAGIGGAIARTRPGAAESESDGRTNDADLSNL
jgi:hypothetical protein